MRRSKVIARGRELHRTFLVFTDSVVFKRCRKMELFILCVFAPSRLCVSLLQFNAKAQRRKDAERDLRFPRVRGGYCYRPPEASELGTFESVLVRKSLGNRGGHVSVEKLSAFISVYLRLIKRGLSGINRGWTQINADSLLTDHRGI